MKNNRALASRSISSSLHLKTTHGKIGLVLFTLLYGIVPGFLAASSCRRAKRKSPSSNITKDEKPASISATTDKGTAFNSPAPSVLLPAFPNSSASNTWRPTSWPVSGANSTSQGLVDETEEVEARPSTPGAGTGFQVLNRPARVRHASAPSPEHLPMTSRRLGEVDWLKRRRTLNSVVSIFATTNID